MRKLEDISKENMFRVPEGYFERLPGVIQARIAKPAPSIWFIPVFKFAVPAMAFIIALSFWLNSGSSNSIEDQLNEIQTEQLLAYLDNNEVSVDLLSDEISLSEDEFYELEEKVFSSMEPFDITPEDLSVLPDNF